MKVKVLKCDIGTWWYKKLIGKEFEVTEYDEKNWKTTTPDGDEGAILKSDCELIPEVKKGDIIRIIKGNSATTRWWYDEWVDYYFIVTEIISDKTVFVEGGVRGHVSVGDFEVIISGKENKSHPKKQKLMQEIEWLSATLEHTQEEILLLTAELKAEKERFKSKVTFYPVPSESVTVHNAGEAARYSAKMLEAWNEKQEFLKACQIQRKDFMDWLCRKPFVQESRHMLEDTLCLYDQLISRYEDNKTVQPEHKHKDLCLSVDIKRLQDRVYQLEKDIMDLRMHKQDNLGGC